MRTIALTVMLLLAAACAGEAGPAGTDGTGALVRTTVEAPGARCATGGTAVASGADLDRDGVLDDAEIGSTVLVCNGASGEGVAATPEASGPNCPDGGVKVTPAAGSPMYVCNGADGAPGESVTVTLEVAGVHCAHGGQRIQVGASAPTYVCDGAPGATGATGAAGESVTVTPEPEGAACAFGGQRLQVGAGEPTFVCDGAPGAAGESVAMTPEPPGAACAFGGQRLQVGASAPTYVCDGAPGAAGESVTMTPEPPGPNCGLGGVALRVGTGPVSYLCSGAPAGATLPAVATVGAPEVRYVDATVHGEVVDDGSELVFSRGVAVATHALPTLHDAVYLAGPGAGPFAVRCDGLAPATTYFARAFATNALGTSFGEEISFSTRALAVPALSTLPPANVTDSTAVAGGDVTDDGGTPVLARGACWSVSPDPTLADGCAGGGAGAGSFLALLTGLPPDAALHVRAYATNAQGTAWGEDRAFTTAASPLATVTTAPATSVGHTTATGGGTVVSDHGAPVTSRGVCWSTAPAPTLAGTCSSEAGGLGAFTASLTGLSAGTTYHLRAFAVNSGGPSYGNEVTLTTLAMTTPVVTTKPASGVSSYFAGSGGVIATDGGSPVTQKGVCWGLNPNPTVADGRTSDGAGAGAFNSTLVGLAPLTTYHVRAYATNALGTSYGNDVAFTTTDLVAPGPTVPVVGTAPSTITGSDTGASGGYVSNDGGSAVVERGVCWSTAQSPTIADSCSADGGGVGFFSSTLTGLGGCGVVYYVRAYATNATGTGYGNQNTVSTGLAPTVTTAAVTDVGTSGGTSGGDVVSDGGCPVTEKGVAYGWAPNPTTANLRTTDGPGSGAFASTMTGLYGNRTHYVRAYATNSVGTAYGPQVVFTTAEPPTPYLGQSYAGGIVFHVDGTGLHGLVAAPADLGRPIWGCPGTSIPTGSAVGTGATNTAAIVASCAQAGIAARVADDLVLNGYDDWFLPSIDELALMYTNLHAKGLGGFGNDNYYSSTEANASQVRYYSFWGNFASTYPKDVSPPSRAVRAF